LPAGEVDATLGRASRELLATRPTTAASAVGVLAERAIAEAQGRDAGSQPGLVVSRADADFARGLGAAAALARVEASPQSWPREERMRIEAALRIAASTAATREAMQMLAGPAPAETRTQSVT
jgi:hypothetical protein